jgi:hypothetical protein
MTPGQPKTATMNDIHQAAARVGVRQHRLEWAVQFAQKDLMELSPGQRLDRGIEVKAFLMYSRGVGGDPEKIHLPGDEIMQAVQRAFAHIIERVLRQEPVDLGQDIMTTSLMWIQGKPRFAQIPDLNRRPLEQLEVYQASCGLAMLIDAMYEEGRLIKVCGAPKPRSKTAERCGRWFVGRPNQTFCSPACRNLANTRATRAKQQQKTRRRISGKT